jgi:hypothetical protein
MHSASAPSSSPFPENQLVSGQLTAFSEQQFFAEALIADR